MDYIIGSGGSGTMITVITLSLDHSESNLDSVESETKMLDLEQWFYVLGPKIYIRHCNVGIMRLCQALVKKTKTFCWFVKKYNNSKNVSIFVSCTSLSFFRKYLLRMSIN